VGGVRQRQPRKLRNGGQGKARGEGPGRWLLQARGSLELLLDKGLVSLEGERRA